MSSSIQDLLETPLMRQGCPDKAIILDEVEGDLRWKRLRLWNLSALKPRLLPWIVLNPAGSPAVREPAPLPRKGAGWCMAMLSWRWGFDGFVTYNVFPFADPDPKTLARFERERGSEPIERTYELIAQDASPHEAAIAAWGSAGPPSTAGYVMKLLRSIETARGAALNLWCVGVNGDGHPRHASRLSHDTTPHRYDGRSSLAGRC